MKLSALPELALGGLALTAALALLPSSASAVAFETGFTCSPGAGPSYEVCGTDMLAVQGMDADPAWDVVFENMRHIEPAPGTLNFALTFAYDADLAATGIGGSLPLVDITGITLTEMGGAPISLVTSGPILGAVSDGGVSYSATFEIPAGAPTYVHDFHVSCQVNSTAAGFVLGGFGLSYSCADVVLTSFTFGELDGTPTLTPGEWTTDLPEPASAAMLGAGLFLAGAVRRRRRTA